MRINLQADCQVAERIFDGSNPTVTGEEVTSAFKDIASLLSLEKKMENIQLSTIIIICINLMKMPMN